MKNKQNHYQILHVQPDAPAQIIQSSYRTLMQKLNAHPDRGGDTSTAALINNAYAVLSDVHKRAEYDRALGQRNDAETSRAPQNHESGEPVHSSVSTACPFCGARHQLENEVPAEAYCVNCRSPLCLVEQQRLEKSDQRKIARIGKHTTLNFFTHWPQVRAFAGVTINISKQGMLFTTSHKVAVDSILKLDCGQIQSIACVLNCRQAGTILRPEWHVGVRFLTLHFESSRGIFISDTA